MNQPSPLNKLITVAKQDPKKAAVLLLLVLGLGGLWVKRVTTADAGPKPAAASTVKSTKKVAAGDKQSAEGREPNEAIQEWIRNPINPLQRNLFAVKLDYFPQDGTRVNLTLRTPAGAGFWDKVAKSMTAQAEQEKERQFLLENLKLQAAQLKLETTVMGAEPRALINGQLVGVGGVVASFRVLKIEARRIIVEREGIKLEILMK